MRWNASWALTLPTYVAVCALAADGRAIKVAAPDTTSATIDTVAAVVLILREDTFAGAAGVAAAEAPWVARTRMAVE